MKKNLMITAFVTILLSFMAINANSTADNTFRFTGNFGLQNPCNGEIVQGPIDINIVVTTNQNANGGVMVNVHHTSHGTLNGNQGNEYQVSRVAKGFFNAISNQYVVDWRGEFVGKGTAPNFSSGGQLRVFVNAQNEPIGSQLVFISSTCN